MNRFKVNLHPAFFVENYEEREVNEQNETVRQLSRLQKELIKEFSTSTDNFLATVNQNKEPKIFSKYTDVSELRRDHKRFVDRTKYSELWNKKIAGWFWDLIAALYESKYFDGKNVEEETAKIKEKYWNEVKDQYIDKVRFSSDKEFNGKKGKDGLKDVIFWRESGKDYPANKIYCELTWATTIDRLNKGKITTYDVDPQNKPQNKPQTQNEKWAETLSATAKQRIEFLAHDLPNYLWEVKDKTTLEKILWWTPIIRSRVDAPSFEDKKQIKNFIKAVDKLNGEDAELKLIKAFDSLQSNATEDNLKDALKAEGLELKDPKYIKHIKRAFAFYISTQAKNNSAENQHALYLSILQIVQKQGWFDKAIKAFEKDVAEYKEKEDKEWKEYKKWKKLKENDKDFAEKLWIKNFTSATRLSEKTEDYFANTAIVDILADINNDGRINFADKWLTKTWAQFKEIYNMVWEEVALPNLLAQAKMVNSVLKTEIKDAEFTKDEIKKWNKKLILLLQSVISNPGLDLYGIMVYGPDAAKRQGEMYETLQKAPESDNDPRVKAAAKEKLKGIDLSNLEIEWTQVASAEWLHQAVSWALYAEYMRWVGLGWRISFEEWVKWVSLNGWIQTSDKWVSVWLGLWYNREINLWKGWSVTPGASLGFIPMFKFGDGFSKPEWSGSVWVELAKKWISKHSVEHKIWWRFSFTEVFWAAHVYTAFLWYDRDKVEWIDKDRPNMEKEFNTVGNTPFLNNIAEKFKDREFDLTKQDNQKLVEDSIDEMVSKLSWDKWKFNNKDIQRLKENTLRHLINYNKAPITNEIVRQDIANEMSKNYSYAWAEQRKNDIDWKTYFSWANVWISWIQLWIAGVPAFHAWVNFKTQSRDISADMSIQEREVKAKEGSQWNQEMIDDFNKYLLVSPESKFSLKDWYVVIPAKAMSECDIKINPDMKWLIKKDESWNVLLSTETFMDYPTTSTGGARKHVEVFIWGWNKSEAINLKNVLSDPNWFTKWNIDTTKLTGKETVFSKESLESALQDLKDQLPNDKDLQAFNFDEAILKELENGKKYKITLWKLKNETTWELTKITPTITEVEEGKALQLEYEGKKEIREMMKENAQAIAKNVYGEALKVTSNRLYLVSHDIKNNKWVVIHKKWEDYESFAKAVKWKSYSEAKKILLDEKNENGKVIKEGLLSKMDKNIWEGVKFSSIAENLNKITDDVELWQAMLSINNIFARVSSVQGWRDNKYHFKKYEKWGTHDRPIWEIIGLRSEEIKRKIDRSSLWQDVKDAYKELINFAENYRKAHTDKYLDTSRKWVILQNAVWINLWNSISIENPLFNPEVYEGSIIEWKDLNFKWKDELRLHALEEMAKDKSLIWPILSELGISPDSEAKNIKRTEDGRISIDFGQKNVILNANMKFGYFAQCVNHMILLDEISAEIPGEGASVSFWESRVAWNWKVREWMSGTMTRTVRTWVELTVTPRQQKKQEEPEKPADEAADTTIGGGKVPDTDPNIIEYDENGNPITPPNPENPTTPPVAPDDNTWGWTWWWWRRRP